jgi:hypothetical protein
LASSAAISKSISSSPWGWIILDDINHLLLKINDIPDIDSGFMLHQFPEQASSRGARTPLGSFQISQKWKVLLCQSGRYLTTNAIRT